MSKKKVTSKVASEAKNSVKKTTAVKTPVESSSEKPKVSVVKKVEKKQKTASVKPKNEKSVKQKSGFNCTGAVYGTGKKKTSVAKIWLKDGSGTFIVNGRDLSVFAKSEVSQKKIQYPLQLVNLVKNVDVRCDVIGGGSHSQMDAIRHGVAKALIEYKPELKPELKSADLLTRDNRIVERKKYGKRKARRSVQFSKR